MKVDNFLVLDSIYGKFIVPRTCLFQAEALVKTGRTHIEDELSNILPLNLISQIKNLKFLQLRITGLRTIPPSIKNLHKLEWLNLEGNYLEILPKEVGSLLNLKYINICRNHITTFFTEDLIKEQDYAYFNETTPTSVELFRTRLSDWNVLFIQRIFLYGLMV